MGFPVVPADGEYRAAVRRAATRLAGLRKGECKDTSPGPQTAWTDSANRRPFVDSWYRPVGRRQTSGSLATSRCSRAGQRPVCWVSSNYRCDFN